MIIRKNIILEEFNSIPYHLHKVDFIDILRTALLGLNDMVFYGTSPNQEIPEPPGRSKISSTNLEKCLIY